MYSAQIISEVNQKFSSQYRVELANHVPMALVALEKMGASPIRLRAYCDHYVKILEAKPTSSDLKITADNWRDFLGINKFHCEYLQYFTNCLATTGLKETLEDHLPELCNGVAGGAFHGLIRLGYALDSSNMEEVGEALSYWAVSFLDLGARNLGTGLKSPKEIFDELNSEFAGFRPDAPNIARRMEMISKLDRFRQICSQLDVAATSYESIASLVLALFAQTQDFTALHGLTATHAFRLVSPYCPFARELFIGLAAAYVSIRAPRVNKIEKNEIQVAWKDLQEKAIQSNDDHVPKIVYSCYEEFCVRGDPLYFDAAKRYVEKVS